MRLRPLVHTAAAEYLPVSQLRMARQGIVFLPPYQELNRHQAALLFQIVFKAEGGRVGLGKSLTAVEAAIPLQAVSVFTKAFSGRFTG